MASRSKRSSFNWSINLAGLRWPTTFRSAVSSTTQALNRALHSFDARRGPVKKSRTSTSTQYFASDCGGSLFWPLVGSCAEISVSQQVATGNWDMSGQFECRQQFPWPQFAPLVIGFRVMYCRVIDSRRSARRRRGCHRKPVRLFRRREGRDCDHIRLAKNI